MPSVRGRELLGASKPWLQQLWASRTTDSCYFSSIYADHPSQNVKTRWHLLSGQAGVLLYKYNRNNKPSMMCAHRSSAVVRFSLSRFNWNRLDPLPYHWEWMWSLSATPLLPLSIPGGNELPGSLSTPETPVSTCLFCWCLQQIQLCPASVCVTVLLVLWKQQARPGWRAGGSLDHLHPPGKKGQEKSSTPRSQMPNLVLQLWAARLSPNLTKHPFCTFLLQFF